MQPQLKFPGAGNLLNKLIDILIPFILSSYYRFIGLYPNRETLTKIQKFHFKDFPTKCHDIHA
jgi:hypothetical protein